MRSIIKHMLSRMGIRIIRQNKGVDQYESDGLQSVHNHNFLRDEVFQLALKRGLQADPNLGFMTWRLHVALWAARHASSIPGDFVECGVNRGFLSSAIMSSLDWNRLNRSFFLFDTFQGIATEFLSAEEIKSGRLDHNRLFSECFEDVERNFAEFQRVQLVRGRVPETLATVDIGKVAYLSIDMNCAQADAAAFEHFWPRLVPGAVILLDDYAYHGFEETYSCFNRLASRYHVPILSLPTGQGLILKT